jgi:hypothetical protein
MPVRAKNKLQLTCRGSCGARPAAQLTMRRDGAQGHHRHHQQHHQKEEEERSGAGAAPPAEKPNQRSTRNTKNDTTLKPNTGTAQKPNNRTAQEDNQRKALASPSDKLAESLEVLHTLQVANGAAAIRARDMTRTHRERLLANGFLREVVKGWYIPTRPDEVKGESTAWYGSFWSFTAAYLESRFRRNWSLSPEQSLSLHSGNWTVPR